MQQLGQLLGVPLLLTRCSCSSWWFDAALCAARVFITDDNDGQAIEMAFSKRTVEDRKTWLSNYVPGTFLNMAGYGCQGCKIVGNCLALNNQERLPMLLPMLR